MILTMTRVFCIMRFTLCQEYSWVHNRKVEAAWSVFSTDSLSLITPALVF